MQINTHLHFIVFVNQVMSKSLKILIFLIYLFIKILHTCICIFKLKKRGKNHQIPHPKAKIKKININKKIRKKMSQSMTKKRRKIKRKYHEHIISEKPFEYKL